MNIGYPQSDVVSNFPSFGQNGAGEVTDRMMASTGSVDLEPNHFPIKITKPPRHDDETTTETKKPKQLEEEDKEDDDAMKVDDAKGEAESAMDKKKRRKKKWKKPKDKPNRPLSAYNLFFQHQRALMLGDDAPSREAEKLKKRVHCKTHGKIGFAEMAKAIGSKWKNLDPQTKKVYETQAQKEKQRYAIELAAWKQAQKHKGDNKDQGLDAMVAAAMMDQGGTGPNAFNNARMMMAADRQGLSPFLQQRPNQDMSLQYLRALQEQRQMDQQSAFLGRQRLDGGGLLEYPNAAEASANAIMQQFQQGFQRQPTSVVDHLATTTTPGGNQLQSQLQNQLPSTATNTTPQQQQQPQQQQPDQFLRAAAATHPNLDSLQQLARFNPNMAAAAMRQFQQSYNTNRPNYSGGDLNFRL